MAEARFRSPDGKTGTIRGASLPAIHRKAEEMGVTLIDPQEAAGSTAQAVNNAVGARVLNGASNTAEAVLNAPGRAINPLMNLASRLYTGKGGLQVPRIDLPSGNTIASAIETPMQAVLAGQSMGDAFDARMSDRARVAQDRPVATMAGEVGADVAGLTALRSPMRGGQAGGAFDSRIKQGVDALVSMVNPAKTKLGPRSFASDLIGSGATRAVARGAGRVGEAAIEGAAMGVLQDGDPAELAATSAGIQAVGSAGNQLRDLMVGEPGKFSLRRTAGTIAAGTVALGLLAETAPFDPDNPLEPLEWLSANFEKVVTGAALGVAVGLAGRRGSTNPGTMGSYFPEMADALSAVPRTSILEMVRESNNDEFIARALQNAPALGESDSKRFVEIMKSDSPAAGLRDWAGSVPRIRQMLTAPDPRLAGVPEKNDG